MEDQAFLQLAEDAKGLYLDSECPRIEKPDPLHFYREYVAKNKPVIITGAFNHWKAKHLWSNRYLRKKAGETLVHVNVTPTGLGDAVVEDKYFVKPEERIMKLGEFLSILEHQHNNRVGVEYDRQEPVFYLSHQNGNLETELRELYEDIDEHVPFFTEALGTLPDVTNIWIGNDRATTSLHKDHYENVYAVLAGEKHFTLYPPTDYFFMYEQPYTSATYKSNYKPEVLATTTNGDVEESSDVRAEGSTTRERPEDFEIVEDRDESNQRITVPWIPVEPESPDYVKHPLFRHATPIHIVVKAGEMLYLPSMYFHQVKQKADQHGRVIAVNFWYDMQYDIKFAYFKFMEAVANQKKGTTTTTAM